MSGVAPDTRNGQGLVAYQWGTALIDLELTEKQAGRVKPGVTAWMEL